MVFVVEMSIGTESRDLFIEKMDAIYYSEIEEEALYALLCEFVDIFKHSKWLFECFDVLFYVLRNSRKIYSETVINFTRELILSHKDFFYLDLYRLKGIGYNCDPPPTILNVCQNTEHLYDLEMIWGRMSFEEIKNSFSEYTAKTRGKKKLDFDNVRIIRSEDGYDITPQILIKARKLGYLD